MDDKTRAWVEGVEERRKAKRDAQQDERTYIACKIRLLIELEEKAQAEREEWLRRGEAGAVWEHIISVGKGELRGFRACLQIVTGTRR